MSSTRHRQDWQELRNSGMSVGQMAKMFGVTDAMICNHTYAPMPEDIAKGKRLGVPRKAYSYRPIEKNTLDEERLNG